PRHLTSLLICTPPHPTPTLSPYTTLFRSSSGHQPSTPSAKVLRWASQAQLACSLSKRATLQGSRTVPRKSFSRITECKTTWKCSDRKSTRLNSSHDQISYAVLCLK